MKKKKNAKIRSRYYMIMQYEKNPLTGEDLLFNETAIKRGILEKTDSLMAWAYIRHDKDVYNQDDDIPEGKEIGDVRPAHWHVMLHFKNAIEISSLANAFGVPENYIEAWKGRGAFLDGIQYLTHEHQNQQELGKHLYGRDEVVFASEKIANEYWDVLDSREEKRLYSLPKSELVERMMNKKSDGVYGLEDAYKDNKNLYSEYEALFKRTRKNYLKNASLPLVRSNYYITGLGGAGKSVSAKAMARSLYPDVPDEKLYFVVGDGRVAFDGYDGQPVIIWDDWRAKDLLSKFDRGTIWKIFAINPEKISLQVKYGDTNLLNTVNIVTSVQPFKEFIEDLSGEYVDNNKTKHAKEDPGQGYRRFPMFVEVTRESLQIYISQSLSGGELSEYNRVCRVEASMIEYAKNSGLIENTTRLMQPVKVLHEKIEKKHGEEKNKEEPRLIDIKVEYDTDSGFFD